MSFVDVDGHRKTNGGGRNCAGDRLCEVDTVVGGGKASGTRIEGAIAKPVALGPYTSPVQRANAVVQGSHNQVVLEHVQSHPLTTPEQPKPELFGVNSDQAWQVVAIGPYSEAYSGRLSAKLMGCTRPQTSVTGMAFCKLQEARHLFGYAGDASIDKWGKDEDIWDDGYPARPVPRFIWPNGPKTTLYGLGRYQNGEKAGERFIDFCGSPGTSAIVSKVMDAEVRCR